MARCTLCIGQSSAIMTHAGAMYSAPDAGAAHISWSWCRADQQLDKRVAKTAAPLATTVWLLKPASQDLAHRNHQILSNIARSIVLDQNGNNRNLHARPQPSHPPKQCKFVHLTPLRSVRHDNGETRAAVERSAWVWTKITLERYTCEP